MTRKIGSLVVLIAGAMVFAACGSKVVVTPAPTPMVATAPSSAVVATVPTVPAPPTTTDAAGVSPGSSYVWVQGYYNWDGSQYHWVPGSWVQVPNPGAAWVPAHWQPTNGGYVWVAGTWR